jgi:hypothetical protein
MKTLFALANLGLKFTGIVARRAPSAFPDRLHRWLRRFVQFLEDFVFAHFENRAAHHRPEFPFLTGSPMGL